MSKEIVISRRAFLGLGGLAALGYAVYEDKVNNPGESYQETQQRIVHELQREGKSIATRDEVEVAEYILWKTDTQYKIDHPNELMAALRTNARWKLSKKRSLKDAHNLGSSRQVINSLLILSSALRVP